MKKILAQSYLLFITVQSFAQTLVFPGSKLINPTLLYQANMEMSYYNMDNTGTNELGYYEVSTTFKNERMNLSIHHQYNGYDESTNTVVDGKKFSIISRATNVKQNNTSHDFTIENGVRTYTKSNEKIKDNYNYTLSHFDYTIYPYVLSMLPIKLGGDNFVLPIVQIDPVSNAITTDEVIVIDTKSEQLTSPITGQHLCWKLTVVHKQANKFLNYYIDKENRKLRKIEHLYKGRIVGYSDKEVDINLFKSLLNKEATWMMMNGGKATIVGEAWAKDDLGLKDDRKINIGVVNFAKKQFAPKGTKILLIPNTDFYKEWFELNKKQAKIKGASMIPLPKEAMSLIKTAEVFDDKGNFEFANLQPGDFILYTSFIYEDTVDRNVETGRSDVYINGSYQGTETHKKNMRFAQSADAIITMNITIKTDGEMKKVKLKK
jgi:hypothetical protein